MAAENLKPAWQPGQSGNPAGRPKGARSKLSEAFLNALLTSFNEAAADGGASAGLAAIRLARDTDPATYARIIAGLLPKEITGADEAPLFPVINVKFGNDAAG